MHKTLRENVIEHVRAGFSGLWIESHEHDQAIKELAGLCGDESWKLLTFDVAKGLNGERNTDPLNALNALKASASRDSMTLLALPNFHKLLPNSEVLQHVYHALIEGKELGTFLIVLAPVVQIPAELEKLFVVLRHDLPTREELDAIARGIGTQEGDLPEDMDSLLDAAVGLTRYEAEAAFALSLARHGKIESSTLWELKAQALEKSGLASLYRGDGRYTFDTLKGYEHLRELTRKLLRRDCPIPARGWILSGPPGCGKTSLVKAIADDNGLPLIISDLGAMKGSLVGQSEQLIRRFIALCEAMAPCVVLVDEIEDSTAGATSAHVGDSGVGKDQLSQLLKWRSESKSRIFFCGTSNDPSALFAHKGGAFVRDGRFDGVVFVDLPGPAARIAIWELYRDKFGVGEDESWDAIDDGTWTPANIESCCQRAVQFEITLAEAARYVRKPDRDMLEKTREWAESVGCLSASDPGMYRRRQPATIAGSRRVTRSSNSSTM